jgi:hypothetical protein
MIKTRSEGTAAVPTTRDGVALPGGVGLSAPR